MRSTATGQRGPEEKRSSYASQRTVPAFVPAVERYIFSRRGLKFRAPHRGPGFGVSDAPAPSRAAAGPYCADAGDPRACRHRRPAIGLLGRSCRPWHAPALQSADSQRSGSRSQRQSTRDHGGGTAWSRHGVAAGDRPASARPLEDLARMVVGARGMPAGPTLPDRAAAASRRSVSPR